jgi:hypothetical protein
MNRPSVLPAPTSVIPAEAGTQGVETPWTPWIPASAGMTQA